MTCPTCGGSLDEATGGFLSDGRLVCAGCRHVVDHAAATHEYDRAITGDALEDMSLVKLVLLPSIGRSVAAVRASLYTLRTLEDRDREGLVGSARRVRLRALTGLGLAFVYPIGFAMLAALGLLLIALEDVGLMPESLRRDDVSESPSELLMLRSQPPGLVREGPAPGPNEPVESPEGSGFEPIAYYGDAGRMTAWVARPEDDSPFPYPVLVYVHDDFGVTSEDLAAVAPLVDRGIVVVVPSFRGENGNAGSFELAYGEVDDLGEAVRQSALLEDVDQDRMYVFGKGWGGNLAGLLAAMPEVNVRLTASFGRLPDEGDFTPELAPFDPSVGTSLSARVFLMHLHEMSLTHVAYYPAASDRARPQRDWLERVVDEEGFPVEIRTVEGDGDRALTAALSRFADGVLAAD